MGINPETHEPVASSSYPNHKSHASISTRHMAQWESARLEAEARLSIESSSHFNNNNNPNSITKTDSSSSDYFLRIWNSEVGDAFRNVNKITSCCQSPISAGSLSTNKCDSVIAELASNNPISNIVKEEFEWKNYKFCAEDLILGYDSSSSNDMDDSSDTALQLLLDFPMNNDMNFLENSFAFSL
ncbi:protein ODORANT1-like [Trifolium pratense]|uniref:Protein ODORANT1-like n=1 Tax=Trifolium pratense TaxID=57577 RepID=A0A2K3MIT0_TRIPR|nr:protein ODORANT1-like [Trifolium pratense]PNX90664.1 protein ODORANT1-like [Trifolium pratense]